MPGIRTVYRALGRAAYWLVWPISWLYLRDSQRTRLLLLCDDKILLVENWLGAGKWHLPGGGMHAGEDPILGMLRELKEETAIVLDSSTVRRLATEPYNHHGFTYTCHYFIAHIIDRPDIRLQKLEIMGSKWIKRSEISSDRCGPDVIRALQLVDSREYI